jgi:DNA-3-methyladenine glycosylase I
MSRCFGDGDPPYERYHDTEWGFPVADERALFELMSLEAFQSGLSWRTILAKREAFRRAFANFEADAVARFGPADIDRLLGDAGIVRNRAKIEATIANARVIVQLHASGRQLTEIVRLGPAVSRRSPPAAWSEVPASTPEAAALARDLKGLGFRFLGPTTLYSLMQATGVVDDHLATCPTRPAAERARRAAGLI